DRSALDGGRGGGRRRPAGPHPLGRQLRHRLAPAAPRPGRHPARGPHHRRVAGAGLPLPGGPTMSRFWVLLRFSLGQLLAGRRLVLIALLVALPLVVPAVFAAGADIDPATFTLELFRQLVLPVLLPVVTLTFATSSLGSELRDGTATTPPLQADPAGGRARRQVPRGGGVVAGGAATGGSGGARGRRRRARLDRPAGRDAAGHRGRRPRLLRP